ncbi:hypothetical protein E1212_20765 [Jiangella ureilytica]|uniref:Uncharacterized protein n=1 Tax=Jiangella ureilytica TaxID=2530374 RepID=A0A4R4RGJ1_9ACTN|nr:hypothetical protein [Jiangella ureilytica]TDC48541.1 hypothetical protein E1212_20765 [Jiangella ureilytica]
MTDTLKELFEDALAGEPTRPVSPDEDIARGRAQRARQRRQRWSTGVAVVAVAWLGALIAPSLLGPGGGDVTAGDGAAAAPYDELPPIVPLQGVRAQVASGDHPASSDAGSQSGGSFEGESGAESGGDEAAGLEPAAMLGAIRRALPAGLALETGRTSNTYARRHHLVLAGERDGQPVTLRVWWQIGTPDPRDEFRPCSEPVAAFSRTAVWDACSAGMDEQNRWRIIGTPDPQHRVLVVDGFVAAITVAWESHAGNEPAAVLSDHEADRIAEAAWDVAVESTVSLTNRPGGNVQELRSDFELGAVIASWPNVEAALTRVLGPLTPVRLNQPDPDALANWMVRPPVPKVVTATYQTAGGGTVDLAVWQAGPIFGALCTVLTACDVWPGSREYFEPLLMAPADAKGGTALGDQGQAYLVLDGVPGDAAALHRAALEAVFSVLPPPD